MKDAFRPVTQTKVLLGNLLHKTLTSKRTILTDSLGKPKHYYKKKAKKIPKLKGACAQAYKVVGRRTGRSEN